MEVQFIKPYTHLDGIFASNNREGRNLPVLMEHTLQGLVLNAADPVHVANIEVITLVLAEPGK